MRKLLCFLMAVFLIFLGSCSDNKTDEPSSVNNVLSSIKNPNSDKYKISVSFDMVYNDSVGNDWDYFCVLDGKTFDDSILLDASHRGSIAEIQVVITENDSFPDSEEIFVDIPVYDGEERWETVIVTENKGRYIGNTAEWSVFISIKKQ